VKLGYIGKTYLPFHTWAVFVVIVQGCFLALLVRLFPIHMDWMGLEKIVKKFDLFGIQTHPIPLNPHGLRANRTSPKLAKVFDWQLNLGRNILGSIC
jgi:hypothetical protein